VYKVHIHLPLHSLFTLSLPPVSTPKQDLFYISCALFFEVYIHCLKGFSVFHTWIYHTLIRSSPPIIFSFLFPLPCYSTAFIVFPYAILLHRHNVFRYHSRSFSFSFLPPTNPLKQPYYYKHVLYICACIHMCVQYICAFIYIYLLGLSSTYERNCELCLSKPGLLP
jgi:hypothetical protein